MGDFSLKAVFLLTLGGEGEQHHLAVGYLKHINCDSPIATNCRNLSAASRSLVQESLCPGMLIHAGVERAKTKKRSEFNI